MSLAVSDQGILYRLKNSNIIQAWLVLVLAICFGATLASVHLKLAPVIEENKLNETLAQVPELVLGKDLAEKMASENQGLEITSKNLIVDKNGRKIFFNVYEARYQKELKGYVVKTGGQGYADRIELLLGLDSNLNTITGLFVLEQKETPGLGNKVIEPTWRKQFIGKKTSPALKVTKSGATNANDIDAVTGATISSRAVTDIVNSAINAVKEPLTKGAK
ncbi:MAG: FMN-binding protein [Desulfobacteraceae bacterium]